MIFEIHYSENGSKTFETQYEFGQEILDIKYREDGSKQLETHYKNGTKISQHHCEETKDNLPKSYDSKSDMDKTSTNNISNTFTNTD